MEKPLRPRRLGLTDKHIRRNVIEHTGTAGVYRICMRNFIYAVICLHPI